MRQYKIIRTSTVPQSLNGLLKGQLKFLNSFFELKALSGYNEKLEEVRHREGVEIINVSMERRIAPFKDLISLVQLIKVFRREKPMIVHSITPKAGLLTMLAGKITGVPIRMHTFTGLIFPTRTGLMQKLLIKMDQVLCSAATHVYPEGNGVKDDLIAYGITKKPLKVLANGNVNGINLEFFYKKQFKKSELLRLRNDLGITKNDFVFVFVGRLVGDKGINELVQAFEKTTSDVPIKLLLVGPLEDNLDPLQERTLKLIDSNKNIISVGFQKDVRPYFAISDALVFPSYREGFPNVVMQAGAMELPSIVTDINGCNEIIKEDVNGVIIPVKNIERIRLSMLRLVEDNEYYNLLKENSRRMISERYDQQVVWNALLEEYNSLIKENSKK
ncbi:glycosyltransferase family 4 protein [Myroides odoratimimus]|uniref:glycosyltransferase family 4 protein n=1 Tax=Myroides odoratimimus TaxID=76832 RepID=UPI0025781DDE|nr:glycosyltransferase family 4 protein [Myroides odoratimimus]MDM1066148.1 glycosyltransferase family 4 protein [Myroides odoratimimus]MEC4076557.1 glycosyltransferase family 4 protein [Myroides odoratimimus]